MRKQYTQIKILTAIFVMTGIVFYTSVLIWKNISTTNSRFGFAVKHSTLTENIDFYEFRSVDEYLEITEMQKINQRVAEKLVREKVMLFSSLFERQRVGYKGQHTEFIDCPDAYKPAYHEATISDGQLRYFVGFANERYVFGSCNRENSKYYAVNAYLYCSSLDRLLDIRYFISMKSAKPVQSFIDMLSCDNID